MDFNVAACMFLVTQFALGTITELDQFNGLPCWIFYSGIFQLLIKVWSGCYGVAKEFDFSELECEFYFRWFLLGGVLDDDEILQTLGVALLFCEKSRVPESGWAMLEEIFKLASQHGKLLQPWGVDCIKWINRNKLSPIQ
jgi:hypothetical protein